MPPEVVTGLGQINKPVLRGEKVARKVDTFSPPKKMSYPVARPNPFWPFHGSASLGRI